MNLKHPETAHWRDSARRPKFFVVDAVAVFPLFIFLLHITLWTFITAVTLIAFLGILEKFGFTLPIFKRWLLCTLAGPVKLSRPY